MFNKKGMELMVEFAVSLVLLSIVLLSLFFINGKTIVNVNALVESENANLVCNMNLLNFLRFKDQGSGETFEHLLQKSFIQNKPDIFTDPAKAKLDSLLGDEEWNMHIYSGTPLRQSQTELLSNGETSGYFKSDISEAGEFDTSELCYTYLPVPCDLDSPDECVLILEMEVKYFVKK